MARSVWVICRHKDFTAIHFRVNGEHEDAVPRAIAHASDIARRAANERGPLPLYAVINQQGQSIWQAQNIALNRDTLAMRDGLSHGDEHDTNGRYRTRT